jgi:extracellular elastinolytic metalloproteinase
LEENPSTYAFINKPGYWGVHAKGEVWAEILFNVFWDVVDEFGFSKDWFKHKHSKEKEHLYGNKMMMQNVVDGMKLQPCYPTFVDARNAILLADKLNYDGISNCIMWRAFAARGLGENAKAGGKEDFTVPVKCQV